MSKEDQSFGTRVIAWQKAAGRHHLPWQGTKDAYRIWVSEIMLQQTQVDTVMRYYDRFLDRFPTVKALASVDFDTVAPYWAGLGYYARARNLHRAAQEIEEKWGGIFPSTVEGLVTLPGIGRSTAAAISVFAFGAVETILDGNVKRVLCRYLAIDAPDNAKTTALLWEEAEKLLPQTETAAYIQGLMDLGSTVCTRTRPACLVCPVQENCVGRQQGDPSVYPIKKPTRAKPTKTALFLIVFNAETNEILLEKRPHQGIWGGLWSFPEMSMEEVGKKPCFKQICQNRLNLPIEDAKSLEIIDHTFTHFHLKITPVLCKLAKGERWKETQNHQKAFLLNDAIALGVPKPVKDLLTRLGKIPNF